MIRHGENGKMSWAKRRDRKTRGKPFDTSGKTGRDEERDDRRDGMRTRRRDETQGGTRDETDEQRANEATGNGAEDLTGRGTRHAGRRDR